MAVPRGVLVTRQLVALRRAAAMAHAIGGLSVTLRSGCDVVASVEPWVRPRVDRPAPVLGPCAFRNAVAQAWTDHESGRQVGLVGLGDDGLDIEWAVRPPGAVLGFGALRASCAGTWVWALASLLDRDDLSTILDGAADATALAPPDIDLLDARMILDQRLDVSVVCVEANPTEARHVGLLDEVMLRLVAATTTAELLASCRPEGSAFGSAGDQL